MTNINWGFHLAGKMAEFIGGPMDGDRYELPGWALMHDGAIAVPDQGLSAPFNAELNLSDLKIALYRPDMVPGEVGQASIRLTPDGNALRYIHIPSEQAW